MKSSAKINGVNKLLGQKHIVKNTTTLNKPYFSQKNNFRKKKSQSTHLNFGNQLIKERAKAYRPKILTKNGLFFGINIILK